MRLTCGIVSLLPVLMFLTGCSLFGSRGESVDAAPAGSVVSEPVPVGFSVLHKADYNIDDRETFKSFVLLNSESGYHRELGRYSVEVPKPVDFSRQSVVLATMGTQPAGGYAVGVASVVERADRVKVTVSFRYPGPNCINTEARSNPYEFSVIDTVKPVEFEEQRTTQQCE